MKKIINLKERIITFKFDGEVNIDVFIDDMDDVAAEAIAHGLSQKIGDSAAGCKTDAIRRGAVLDMVEQLSRGEWNKKRSGGSAILLEALIRLYPDKTGTELREFIAEKDSKQRSNLSKMPKVAFEIAKIRAKCSSNDGSELLDELEEL